MRAHPILAIALTLSLAGSIPAAQTATRLTAGNELGAWRQPAGNWRVVADAALDPSNSRKLTFSPGHGVITNGSEGPTVDLITKQEFGDCQIHVEFLISKQSNSGVYLMGRYEVQIYDSFGKKTDEYPGIECGGIYPRWINGHGENGHSPRVNASKPAGEWQSFDITFRAPRFDASRKKVANGVFVKVVHNGQVIHENVELTGPTRAAVFDDEKLTGPLMLQGDHGPVAFRNLTVWPLEPPAHE